MNFFVSGKRMNKQKKPNCINTTRLLNKHKLKFTYFPPFQNQIVLESSLEKGWNLLKSGSQSVSDVSS